MALSEYGLALSRHWRLARLTQRLVWYACWGDADFTSLVDHSPDYQLFQFILHFEIVCCLQAHRRVSMMQNICHRFPLSFSPLESSQLLYLKRSMVISRPEDQLVKELQSAQCPSAAFIHLSRISHTCVRLEWPEQHEKVPCSRVCWNVSVSDQEKPCSFTCRRIHMRHGVVESSCNPRRTSSESST